MCKTCKSSDTILEKENRLYFIVCEACGSSTFLVLHDVIFRSLTLTFLAERSVSAIKTGFQAQIGRRKAMAT
jgi:translation initiation factor 2 subunit 2